MDVRSRRSFRALRCRHSRLPLAYPKTGRYTVPFGWGLNLPLAESPVGNKRDASKANRITLDPCGSRMAKPDSNKFEDVASREWSRLPHSETGSVRRFGQAASDQSPRITPAKRACQR